MYTYTIGMYEVEHSGDIEHVIDGLRQNGLVITRILREEDFVECGSETGAIVITSPQDLVTVQEIVNKTDFTQGMWTGDNLDSLRSEAEYDQECEREDCDDEDDFED